MTNKLHKALELAEAGFWIFPLAPGAKKPPLVKFKAAATRDAEQICAWWPEGEDPSTQSNIGIYCGKYGSGSDALLVVDVDKGEKHGGKDGDQALFQLDLEGKTLPGTYTQRTPTGGRHLVYRVQHAFKPGADKLGRGLDIKSHGSYIAGSGSVTSDGPYLDNGADLSDAPEWLTQSLTPAGERVQREPAAASSASAKSAARAREWLLQQPGAVEGSGGDEATYRVACGVRDYGVDQDACIALLLESWNPRCTPPWPVGELQEKVKHAFQYAKEQVGTRSTDALIAAKVGETPHAMGDAVALEEDVPFHLQKFKDYAYLYTADMILEETTNENSEPVTNWITWAAFQRRHAGDERILDGDRKPTADTQLWLKWKDRPTYQGVVFDPSAKADARFYNAWKGFTVPPADSAMHPAVAMWQEHLLRNVCSGDGSLAHWLTGWFAHLIQKPWEKPLVALVLRGAKGVGKNALLNPIRALCGRHATVTAKQRFLTGQFNSHMENLLLFVLDEARWAGDMSTEGIIKDLITGDSQRIERKGQESYDVANLMRIVIIGNYEWLVQASHDERRFAVFHVGPGRQRDTKFFTTMEELFMDGGLAYLHTHLLGYPLERVNLKDAPDTEGLFEQKELSLDSLHQWWYECLRTGVIAGTEFTTWPDTITPSRFQSSYQGWLSAHRIPVRIRPQFMKQLADCTQVQYPALGDHKEPGIRSASIRSGSEVSRVYKLVPLADMRAAWDKFMGHTTQWENA